MQPGCYCSIIALPMPEFQHQNDGFQYPVVPIAPVKQRLAFYNQLSTQGFPAPEALLSYQYAPFN
ncbi:MAG: hypothetical protein KDK39_15880 [Leptospiraceae bacterium]|nr:hypothetical protein [Leptospiraceae bacterium]